MSQYLPATAPLPATSPLYEDVKLLISRAWNMQAPVSYVPSPNPISIERKHLAHLQQNLDNYVVAEKSDGVRYLLLLGTHRVGDEEKQYSVMVNRKLEVFEVSVFANPQYFQGSVFDGELVLQDVDSTSSTEKKRQMFLVFDVMMCKGQLTMYANYFERYKELNRVFEMHQKDILAGSLEKWDDVAKQMAHQEDKIVSMGNRMALLFSPKPCVQATNVGSLWRSMDRMKHKSDGLIFTPVYQPVMTGTHQTMYKWKQSHTLDLLVEGTFARRTWTYNLAYKDKNEFRWVTQEPFPTVNDKPVQLKLKPNARLEATARYFGDRNKTSFRLLGEVTCTLAMEEDQSCYVGWCLIERWRDDKSTPNNIHVINNTLVNIFENINIHELLRLISLQMYGVK